MRPWLPLLGLLLLTTQATAQDRDTKVRNDRKAFGASRDWIYNDLTEGVRAAKAVEQAAAGRLPLHPVRGVPGVRRRRGPP